MRGAGRSEVAESDRGMGRRGAARRAHRPRRPKPRTRRPHRPGRCHHERGARCAGSLARWWSRRRGRRWSPLPSPVRRRFWVSQSRISWPLPRGQASSRQRPPSVRICHAWACGPRRPATGRGHVNAPHCGGVCDVKSNKFTLSVPPRTYFSLRLRLGLSFYRRLICHDRGDGPVTIHRRGKGQVIAASMRVVAIR